MVNLRLKSTALGDMDHILEHDHSLLHFPTKKYLTKITHTYYIIYTFGVANRDPTVSFFQWSAIKICKFLPGKLW